MADAPDPTFMQAVANLSEHADAREIWAEMLRLDRERFAGQEPPEPLKVKAIPRFSRRDLSVYG